MGSLNKCEIIDGHKVLTPFVETNNGNNINGMPIGAWSAFQNDTAPSTEWLRAGTTFDENEYPELYMYLSSNIVPEMFDHSRLGDYETAVENNKQITATYDGYVTIHMNNRTNATSYLYIDQSKDGGNTWIRVYESQTADSASAWGTTIYVAKGDIIKYQTNQSPSFTNKVRYYTHPMFIKATTAASSYTPATAVQEIKNYTKNYVDEKTANANSYSTNETLTGGTWIDGKPIYKKVTPYNGVIESPTLSSSIIINAIVGQPYIDTFISATYVGRRTSATGEKMSATFDTWIQSDTTIKVLATSKMYVENIVSLYTKTTD